ncbi:serine-rich coiled-coil domain-containing protein 1-like isoform X1 [Oncorhynchus keta]|uniref:serine-rich coiled-coil domain-containing protein 1-like isoform X1 n=2 Tax=Oncorhynchus keta TaxID=8018 RepID=UPI00227AFFF6|nr:serine-rich coiled-coil domain-containing protein 1-like isoform X1 [Oncorhynchus keta]
MGESGSCRSTLVSRLPIFRRSLSKRQDSLPSSPSSGGVGNGVHTSSPSSTNSSNSSTGKRRSLFRTPSIRFSSKRNSEPLRIQTPPLDPAQDSNGSQANPQMGFHDGAGPPRAKTRHSFGFGGHRQKKITRSQTEDFEKVSSTANRNVFIKCISSATNEGDDSGFLEDYSGGSKRSSRQKKQLLPKSFSAHHRFSKNSEQCKPTEVSIEPPASGGTLGSWPGELLGESSLQSPMLSEDHTTVLTPSEFNVPITEDTVSEVDALPAPSPADPPDSNFSHVVSTSQVFFTPAQAATDKPLLPDTSTANTTECETAIPVTGPATAATTPMPPQQQQSQEYKEEGEEEKEDVPVVEEEVRPEQTETSESEAGPVRSKGYHSNPEQSERRSRNSVLIQEPGKGACCGRHELRSCHLRKPHTVSMCSSGASPYHEVIRMERRLRSSSEGAGVPRRLHLNLKEPHSATEGNVLLRKRNNSSSSKLGSLDLLNNLGSSELDEDDLMLDLELSDDQRQRHVFREDSSQSLSSCLSLLHSRFEPSGDGIPGREPSGDGIPGREPSDNRILGREPSDNRILGREPSDNRILGREPSDNRILGREPSRDGILGREPSDNRTLGREPSGDGIPGREPRGATAHREPNRPTTLLPTDWCLGREDEAPGLEALPLRLVQQDCTSVKTLLLRLRRTLQESTDTSPASILHSLPISPCSEKSLPLKEPGREEALVLQLREKDELILQLQAELESAKAALKPICQKADRTTQTDRPGSETIHPSRATSQNSTSTRDRRPARSLIEDQYSRMAAEHSTSSDESHCPAPALSSSGPGGGRDHAGPPRRPEGALTSSEVGALRRIDYPASQIPRAVGVGTAVWGSSSSLQSRGSPCRSSLSSDSERAPVPIPCQPSLSTSSSSSSFTGRLGQPPRGPLSLHMYSRKNVFLQHSLYTAEPQSLAQHDG